jgi:Flp pilus assembly pilin Flp
LTHLLRKLWRHDEGQDIAEYAVMLAVILVLVVGTIRLIGSNANNVFSNAASFHSIIDAKRISTWILRGVPRVVTADPFRHL